MYKNDKKRGRSLSFDFTKIPPGDSALVPKNGDKKLRQKLSHSINKYLDRHGLPWSIFVRNEGDNVRIYRHKHDRPDADDK